mmetsp:Transcript_25477/g.73103  ORF Transcript_25477/g.73103 Transcript_25477/m.73103 type:complete len:219 (-) Transcript_25477:3871-4527(-)
MAYASKPESCSGGFLGSDGKARGEADFTLPTTAETCGADAPQAPAKLISLEPAISPMTVASASVLSPAPAETWHHARPRSERTFEALLSCPLLSAPVIPTDSGLACLMLIKNASMLCPEGILPPSVMTAVISSGRRSFFVCSKYSSTAKMAALAVSVSDTISKANRSAPPSTKPRICCMYVATKASQLVLRCDGSSAPADDDSRWLVGPITPATNRGL